MTMSSPSHLGDPRFVIPPGHGPVLKTVQVKAEIAGLYKKPNTSGSIETQLLYGHGFDIYKEDRGWLWGQAHSPVQGSDVPGYVGWIESGSVAPFQVPTHSVTTLKALVFAKADIKAPIELILPLGSLVMVSGFVDNFCKTQAGYIHKRHLREVAQPAASLDFVSIAERHMGLPYIWGGIGTDGLDCSGLVLSSLRAIGQDALRDADVQEKSLGQLIPGDSILKRGDFIFWSGHVGIMQSSTDMIHANAYHMCVASESLDQAVSRIGPIRTIKRLN